MTPSFKKLPKIYQKIINFNPERGWKLNSRDVASSVVIESAELLELFQWSSSRKRIDNNDPEVRQKLSHEVADILIYLFDLCELLDIDFVKAVEEKYDHNSNKYPVDKVTTDEGSKFYFAQKRKYREDKK